MYIFNQHFVIYLLFWLIKWYNLFGEKMEKKKDLRVIKTKKMIYTALVELMKEKTFEEIKVSDICEKA